MNLENIWKESKTMAKIDGKYEQFWTENLLKQINSEDSITKRHRLIAKYLYQRVKQIEKVLANIEDNDIDTTLVIVLADAFCSYVISRD